jgi:hypothetical protein
VDAGVHQAGGRHVFIPLFHPMPHQIDLELKECKPFKNSCVALTYRVKH